MILPYECLGTDAGLFLLGMRFLAEHFGNVAFLVFDLCDLLIGVYLESVYGHFELRLNFARLETTEQIHLITRLISALMKKCVLGIEEKDE